MLDEPPLTARMQGIDGFFIVEFVRLPSPQFDFAIHATIAFHPLLGIETPDDNYTEGDWILRPDVKIIDGV